MPEQRQGLAGEFDRKGFIEPDTGRAQAIEIEAERGEKYQATNDKMLIALEQSQSAATRRLLLGSR
ncbi:MAG TPA: hypothetical protein VFV38_31200 [Ktedonobacteraceae bacterium]|nr:hypothetical protein [Ktedonobacteraceae bacterium]